MKIFNRIICWLYEHDWRFNVLHYEPAKCTKYRHVWGIMRRCTRCDKRVKRYFERTTMMYLEKTFHEK